MKSELMKTQDFLGKLERMDFVCLGENRKTLISKDGFELTYSTKLQSLIGSKEDCGFIGLPVQLIFYIRRNGEFVASWGCVDLEDTTEIAKWYVLKQSELENKAHKDERKVNDTNQFEYDNI